MMMMKDVLLKSSVRIFVKCLKVGEHRDQNNRLILTVIHDLSFCFVLQNKTFYFRYTSLRLI